MNLKTAFQPQRSQRTQRYNSEKMNYQTYHKGDNHNVFVVE